MFRFWRRFASPREPGPYDRAIASLARRNFARAEIELTALLDAATDPPDRAFLLNKRGVARVAMKKTEDARGDFTAAAACVAGYAPALTNLGNVLLEEGRTEDAIAQYERAAVADPNYALAHLNLGAAYKRAGRLKDAVRALRRALALEKPTSAFGRRLR
jgi:tetratricopeptide (TPR) repeat protein